MKRWLHILLFMVSSASAFAHMDTHVVDSLENEVARQEGREKVETMVNLVWAFYDISFDDCIDWGEKAKQLAHEMGDVEMEARSTYAIGVQYGYHNDLDLAQIYLKEAYDLYQKVGNQEKAFDALWNSAYFELVLGNMDSAYFLYQDAMLMAERLHDSLACAQTCANLAVIQYQRNDFEGSKVALMTARNYYEALNDTAKIAEVNLNLATIYGETGKPTEARKLFVSTIPMLEATGNYDFLQLAYKNYGLLFERDFVNYDSAIYYFDKALACTEIEGLPNAYKQTMANTKSDVLTELGNVAALRNEWQQAAQYYKDALSLAETNKYSFGQMQALIGLGQLYAQLGNPSSSMGYFERYAELASLSGITMMEPSIKKSLILNYARLGRYDALQKELEALDEQRSAYVRENSDLSDRNDELQSEISDLIVKLDFCNRQLDMAQSKRNQYRLAFFGLLALVIAAIAAFVLWIIVGKNQDKNAEE